MSRNTRKSIKNRDTSTIKSRRKTMKERNKSKRGELLLNKRKKQIKHILICGHGSLAPDKKGGFPHLPHTNEGDKYLMGMGVKLDENISDNSLLITGTLPGTSGIVFSNSNEELFKRIKTSLNDDKETDEIIEELNDNSIFDKSKLEWGMYAKAQPTIFHSSNENIIIYFHGMQGGPNFYAGIYDIDGCKIPLDDFTFSQLENSKYNISQPIFRKLSEPYDNYFVETSDDLQSEDRSNYYMEAKVWGDKTVGAPGCVKEIDGTTVRPLTIPLNYLEDAIRKHYKNINMQIAFYSTICKSTPEKRAMKKKKSKKKKKKKKKN